MFAIFYYSKIMCVNTVNPKTSRFCNFEHAYNNTRGWKPYVADQINAANNRASNLQRIYKGQLVVRELSEDELQQLMIAKLVN